MKKVSLLLAAFALVIGLSQCRKPNLPVLNAGETQHVVINASWDNGGAKIDQNGTLFKWTIGDKLTVSGGATGNLKCTNVTDGTFEGDITRTSEEKVIFTFKSENYKGDYMEQTGALNDAVSLTGEAPYSAVGKYDVSMTMPHAVLKLDLSKLGTSAGTPVTIKVVGGDPVASVKNVKNDEASKALYVAVPASPAGSSETKIYEFESSAGTARCADGWALVNNTFYTLTGGTGAAIVVEPTLLPGMFSVSATKYVQFSRGNLQATYNGSGYDWALAINQYDYVGNKPGNTTIASQTDGAVVDLFGWSTAATNYGINSSIDPDDYSGNFKDWGSSLGEGSNWSTLSIDEWTYLTSRTGKFGYATVAGFTGLILLPDEFTDPHVQGESGNLPFVPGSGKAALPNNIYSAVNWAIMEDAGAVFLPMCGYRNGTELKNVDKYGQYWSATPYSDSDALLFSFTDDGLETGNKTKSRGCFVRLVQRFFKPHDAVKIGNVYWATTNIGASTPKEKGWYFSWGNTTGYIHDGTGFVAAIGGTALSGGFTADNYNSTTGSKLTGDIPVSATYDAARANWGGEWRIPKADDFLTLRNTTYWAWDDEDKGFYVFIPGQGTSGSAGGRGIIKDTDDKTQAALFFPAAGFGSGSASGDGCGYYWSGSKHSSEEGEACNLCFASNYAAADGHDYRYFGFRIRPVHD